MLEPIFSQIDPLRLGDIARSMRIAQLYGDRLKSQNLKTGALERLINEYPSHTFVIDRAEAETLFEKVRAPSKAEGALAEFVRPLMVSKLDFDEEVLIVRLEPESTKEAPDGGDETAGAKVKRGRVRSPASNGAARAGAGRPVRGVRPVSGKRKS